MQIRLEVIEGPDAGREFVFDQPGSFIVGRGRDVHFCITDDPYVSRIHCTINIAPPRCYLIDNVSKNSTRVNDLVVVEKELQDGDVISVGFTKIRVHIDSCVQLKQRACAGCGKMVEVTEGEEGEVLCDECFEKRRARRHESERPKEPTSPVCYWCGRQMALSRSESPLLGPARPTDVYCCAKCLSQEKSMGKVAGFSLIKTLGEGGMGEVLLAYDEEASRLLAVKMIKGLYNRNLVTRFLRSCRLLEEIDHPNIVKVYGHKSIDDMPFMFMEFAPLGSLEELILHKGEPLPPKQAVHLTLEILKGLEHLHSRKMIHRDIKPQNILLRVPGRIEQSVSGQKNIFDIVPKITDFELIKYFSSSGGITKTGTGMGTPIYAPKELFVDAKTVTAAADIYSVGIMLYYMLSGRFPYNYPTPLDAKRIYHENRGRVKDMNEAMLLYIKENRCMHPQAIPMRESPEPLERKCEQRLSDGLCKAVNKAISREPEDRFQTAGQFIQALEASGV